MSKTYSVQELTDMLDGIADAMDEPSQMEWLCNKVVTQHMLTSFKVEELAPSGRAIKGMLSLGLDVPGINAIIKAWAGDTEDDSVYQPAWVALETASHTGKVGCMRRLFGEGGMRSGELKKCLLMVLGQQEARQIDALLSEADLYNSSWVDYENFRPLIKACNPCCFLRELALERHHARKEAAVVLKKTWFLEKWQTRIALKDAISCTRAVQTFHRNCIVAKARLKAAALVWSKVHSMFEWEQRAEAKVHLFCHWNHRRLRLRHAATMCSKIQDMFGWEQVAGGFSHWNRYRLHLRKAALVCSKIQDMFGWEQVAGGFSHWNRYRLHLRKAALVCSKIQDMFGWEQVAGGFSHWNCYRLHLRKAALVCSKVCDLIQVGNHQLITTQAFKQWHWCWHRYLQQCAHSLYTLQSVLNQCRIRALHYCVNSLRTFQSEAQLRSVWETSLYLQHDMTTLYQGVVAAKAEKESADNMISKYEQRMQRMAMIQEGDKRTIQRITEERRALTDAVDVIRGQLATQNEVNRQISSKLQDHANIIEKQATEIEIQHAQAQRWIQEVTMLRAEVNSQTKKQTAADQTISVLQANLEVESSKYTAVSKRYEDTLRNYEESVINLAKSERQVDELNCEMNVLQTRMEVDALKVRSEHQQEIAQLEKVVALKDREIMNLQVNAELESRKMKSRCSTLERKLEEQK